MRVLLDTHAFLWFTCDNPQLSATARTLIESTDNQPILSIASAWEIAIKVGLGKLVLTEQAHDFVQRQVDLNSFQLLHYRTSPWKIIGLPPHHRDPLRSACYRLLQAHAMEDIPVLSADAGFQELSDYGFVVIVVALLSRSVLLRHST